jgi:hypothetical protein
VEITPLMSFRHLIMLFPASKCLKITLRFSKPENIFFFKLKLRGDIPLSHLRGCDISPIPPLAEILVHAWEQMDQKVWNGENIP